MKQKERIAIIGAGITGLLTACMIVRKGFSVTVFDKQPFPPVNASSIAGGTEAWKVAGRLKAENVPVLLTVNFPRRTTTPAADADPDPLRVLR